DERLEVGLEGRFTHATSAGLRPVRAAARFPRETPRRPGADPNAAPLASHRTYPAESDPIEPEETHPRPRQGDRHEPAGAGEDAPRLGLPEQVAHDGARGVRGAADPWSAPGPRLDQGSQGDGGRVVGDLVRSGPQEEEEEARHRGVERQLRYDRRDAARDRAP